jgi:DNA/RNA endonuclease G (NUC1)
MRKEEELMKDFRSGYDRGHMVPAADAKISQGAMDETFFLSNVAPQVGDGFNRHCTSVQYVCPVRKADVRLGVP